MPRHLVSTGSPFEKAAGFSRAVVDGEFAFVAGTTGYDYSTMVMPADVTAQTQNCFKTVEAGRDRITGARLLHRIDLWEISLVTFPMLNGARVTGIKASALAAAAALFSNSSLLPQRERGVLNSTLKGVK